MARVPTFDDDAAGGEAIEETLEVLHATADPCLERSELSM